MLFKSSITTHQRVTHMAVSFSVIASVANSKSLTDSGSHFHRSGSNRAHIFIAINIMIIFLVIAMPWQDETVQQEFRLGYSYLEKIGPLLCFA